MFGKGVGFSVGNIPLAAEHLKIEIENLIQLSTPVFHQPGGNDHDGPGQLAPGSEFAKDESGLDGLTQSDLVGDQEALGAGIGHPVDQHHLVRQQVHLCRSQGRGAFHQRQFFGFHRQPKLFQPIRCCRNHALDDLIEPVGRWPQRVGRHLPLPMSAKEDRDVPRRLSTDDDAIPQLGVVDLQAGLYLMKCVRHSSQR